MRFHSSVALPIPHRAHISLMIAVQAVAIFSGCASTQLREEHFADGSIRARHRFRENEKGEVVVDGAFTEWHQNGRVARRGRFSEGKHHGVQSSWYESGAKKSVRSYDHGRLDGVSRTFYEVGGKKDQCT